MEAADLRAMHRLMVLSRALDDFCSAGVPGWFPSVGEEATIVGSFYGLRPTDIAGPHYRGPHILFLMRGVPLRQVLATVLGKATGLTKGRAPLFCGPVDLNIVPWVAGDLGPNVGLATGAALGAKVRRTGQIVVTTFGDGTANRGDFHEAVNLASIWSLPIVFVCQNNAYSISMHISKFLRCKSIADRAAGYGIPGQAVDGNDVVAVHETVRWAAERARAGDGPSLIDAQTYRLGGHWAGDPADYRSPGEVEEWRRRDPVARLEERLLRDGLASAADLEEERRRAGDLVEQAAAEAEADPPAAAGGIGAEEVFA